MGEDSWIRAGRVGISYYRSGWVGLGLVSQGGGGFLGWDESELEWAGSVQLGQVR